METIQTLYNLIEGASRITVAVHTHPDGDALGSGLGMVHFLTDNLGKNAVLVLPDSVAQPLLFMTAEEPLGRILVHSENQSETESRIESSDLVFCLDCSSFSRTAGMESSLRASKAKKVLVDHHLNPDKEAFNLVFSTIDSSSASEVLFWTLMELPGIGGDASKLSDGCRKALMTGLTTDTNNFANSVFPSTLDMASKLIATGVDRDAILHSIYNCYRENRIRLMGYMLGEKMKITSDGTAYMILDRKTQQKFDFRQGESEGFVNMPLAIADVRMSVLLTEEDTRFRVSVRSKEGTSANDYARTYCNGGGHELAAGGKINFPEDIPSPDDAEAYILNTSARFFSR